MPEFKCRLITDDGVVLEKVISADSKYEIYDNAEVRKELVLSIKKHKEPFALQDFLDKLQQVKPQEIERFTSQLSIMLDAGVPLLSSLATIADQVETDKMKRVIQSLAEELNSGSSFSQAIGKYPRVFSLMYANMIEAGEKAGVMDVILKRLSQFIGSELLIRDNLKSALRYPIIVFGVLILAFTGAILFVIPRFANLYLSQGVELPLPTRILIGINQAVTNYWMYTLIAVITVVIGIIYFVRTPTGKKTIDFIKLKFPVFKRIFLSNTMARFAHMLETLSRSGIQITSAMKTVEKTVGNIIIGEDIAAARRKVEEGIAIADALSSSKYFPAITLKMISVGEKSGALDEMLNKVAQQYDSEVEHLTKRLTAMIEPMMIVVIGAFLLLIALGIFMPMWKLYEVF